MGVIIEVRNPLEDLEEKIKAHRRRFWRKVILTTVTLLAAAASTYLLVELQTYNVARTVQSYQDAGNDKNSYMQFSNGVIKYSRDGIAFLNRKAEEQWNQSYQIKNPFLNINKDSVVVGDRGGNDILVFNKKGLRGEVHTNYPVESLAVSENGIVCALLKNENTPLIVCYDAAGNMLVEHRASITGTGYPIGMAISPDGGMLQVSYLCVVDGVQATRIIYYDFHNGGTEESEQQAAEEVYKNEIIPMSFFADDDTSILISDQAFYVYKGKDKPSLSKKVELNKEVKSVFYDDEYIGFVLKEDAQDKNELRLYNMSGTEKLSKTFSGEYGNVKIADGSIMMFDGKQCAVFTTWGVQKFDGEMEENILDILPLSGINKYLVMSERGIEEVRFGK